MQPHHVNNVIFERFSDYKRTHYWANNFCEVRHSGLTGCVFFEYPPL